ncbi:bacteriohopanetetrol glucosamine biosynthesis glycosyltransferase HpnI [Oecophyllibacter saccharovorans]|uniref:Glycosyltransferase n=1 Tax=Oecophyllibacter saccharovorans TaxID=2558360 RepID=A0A506ULP7_9PROT|nr:bacteriohopanetetrol glucosamine biosynthesis glycosyltransferase HpnI [Oecophyllibacter saccharovorans]TPW34250.1 glycosyltransferase [Oecophyllibacter saccharovorans]
MPFLTLASLCTALVSVAGQAQSVLGSQLLARFHRRARLSRASLARPENQARDWPAVTLLKPLHGDEPKLEQALESCFQQDYPQYEIVFGLHAADDPALKIVERLKARYPDQPVSVVVDSTEHGPNRKIGNLINMMQACHHDVLVMADSDIHVQPDYLRTIVDTLETPGTGLVTLLYAGLPADGRLVRQLGAHSINNNFLTGVMLSRLLGRQDCLGATMALKRELLERIGGLAALVPHLADDAVLGQKVRALGMKVALAPTLCRTTVAEETLGELLSHELRWGRTVRSLEPVGYAFSSLQLPLFWASVSILLAPASWLAWGIFGLGWLTRGLVSARIAYLTECRLPGIFPFLIVRDWISAAIMLGSTRGTQVAWRGRTVHIASNPFPPERDRPLLNSTDAGRTEASPSTSSGLDGSGINRSVRS